MLKQGIKNYFTSLKFVFTPLGTMFIGMMIGFSILIPGIISAISTLAGGVNELAQSVNLDFKVLGQYLWERVRTLDWNSPVEAVKTMFSSQWLGDVLTRSLETILGSDFKTLEVHLAALIAEFTADVLVNIIAFFALWIMGFFAGYAITKYLVRRSIAKRTIFKFLLAGIINAVLSLIAVVLCIWLFALWKNSIFISVLILIIAIPLFDLLEAYLLFGWKTTSLKKVVNLKNAALYILSAILIFIMSICLTLAAVAINTRM